MLNYCSYQLSAISYQLLPYNTVMHNFTKLKVWQKAHNFTVNLYRMTANFPQEEKFGLTNQIRRAAVSI